MRKVGFQNLEFGKTYSSKFREFPISEVMPVNLGLSNYYAILTQAHIVSKLKSDDNSTVDNFDDLFSGFGLEKTERNLSYIRKEGLIYEGDKCFSSQLALVLGGENSSSNHVHILGSETGKLWEYIADEFFSAEEFFELVDEYCGEFQLTDDANNWYGLLRDDDPIVFVALNDGLSNKLKQYSQDNILGLSPDFNYN